MDMRLPAGVAAVKGAMAEPPPPLRLLQRWQPVAGVNRHHSPRPSLLQRLFGR